MIAFVMIHGNVVYSICWQNERTACLFGAAFYDEQTVH